jgi:ElaB/YqjD/DUF883 family membrane-anchored ribosome-binding protein
MNPKTSAEIAQGDFTPKPESNRAWKEAAAHWAGDVKEKMRENLKKAGYRTETYVRSNPGRFIAGACCLGIAAGFLLGRATTRKR